MYNGSNTINSEHMQVESSSGTTGVTRKFFCETRDPIHSQIEICALAQIPTGLNEYQTFDQTKLD